MSSWKQRAKCCLLGAVGKGKWGKICKKVQTFSYKWRRSKYLIYTMLLVLDNACVCAQSYLTLCNTMDCILPGSSVHRIFREEYRNGLLFPPTREHPNPGIRHSGAWQTTVHRVTEIWKPVKQFSIAFTRLITTHSLF